jgi:hypothetical protein
MDFDNLYNSLSYDEMLLSEKLGLVNDYRPNKVVIDNKRTQNRERAKEIELQNRIKNELMKQRIEDTSKDCSHIRDGSQKSIELDDMDELVTKKVLLFLIVILAAFCIIQYFNQQQLSNSLNQLLQAMNGTYQQSGVQSGVQLARPAQVAQPTQGSQPAQLIQPVQTVPAS